MTPISNSGQNAYLIYHDENDIMQLICFIEFEDLLVGNIRAKIESPHGTWVTSPGFNMSIAYFSESVSHNKKIYTYSRMTK